MLPLKSDKPIKYENNKRIPPVEDIIFFFKHCFNPAERKFKIILLFMLGAGIRIGEACAVNLKDVVGGSNYRSWKVMIQKKKTNYIVNKEIPESIAAHIRSWIIDNERLINEYGGFLFPPSHNHKYMPYTSPKTMQAWFCSKRRQLIKQFPEKSFSWIESYRHYKNKNIGGTDEPLYLWRPHLMKRLTGTLIYLATHDPVLVKEMLCHSKLETTYNHYIAIAENYNKSKVINKVFDADFYDAINDERSIVSAVWNDIKK